VLLREFATRLAHDPLSPAAFAAAPEVQQGLHRFWLGLTWLGASNRIVAHVQDEHEQETPQEPLTALQGQARTEEKRARLSSLTEREHEVMLLRVAAGKLNKVIADELHVSVRTVSRSIARAGLRKAGRALGRRGRDVIGRTGRAHAQHTAPRGGH
jgi:DNA-binding CsgD family transcriptional regulator